jgi:hypothetical protein
LQQLVIDGQGVAGHFGAAVSDRIDDLDALDGPEAEHRAEHQEGTEHHKTAAKDYQQIEHLERRPDDRCPGHRQRQRQATLSHTAKAT